MRWYNSNIRQTLSDVFEAAYNDKICGYTKTELAKRAKLSQSCIYNLRRGKTKDPRFSTILKLCRAVNMDMFYARQQLGLIPATAVKKKRGYPLKVVG